MNELIIKGEFINFLKSNLKERSDDEIINNNKIRKLVYAFIFEKVVGTGEKEIKVKKEPIVNFYFKVVDFCLSFGEVIINTLSTLREYKDFEGIGLNDSEFDA
ncbi:unnamed protein product [marine sediment metagenome]|uniref:Uncharacterized protein n=1 Tax=marine sediment metagenome TaxID=412755 RepID=X1HHI7_9ZZZZ